MTRPRALSAALLATLLIAAFSAEIAAADIRGIPPRWRSSSSGGRTKEGWQYSRLLLGGGVGWPTTFPSGWKPGLGWSAAELFPIHRAWDVSLEVEMFEHRFDAAKLRRAGATVSPIGEATFFDLALGARLHGSEPGWRWFGSAAIALPDVSRPAVSYTDAGGAHTLEGSEIFAFDPGFVMAVGVEHFRARGLGGAIEARMVVAPGRTKPTEILAALRAGLAIPLPY